MRYDFLAPGRFFLGARVTAFVVEANSALFRFIRNVTPKSPRSPARILRTGAPVPWLRQCASPRRWTGTRGRERCRLRLFPIHRRSLAPPTRARPWYVEAAVHICIDRAQDDCMDRYALAGQERSQRLRHVKRGCLRNGVGGYDRQASERHQR
jgi:hypothetical protein